jgi:enolase
MNTTQSLLVTEVLAREILDSRGFPTLEAEVTLAGGAVGRAAVPSGASTGKREALELRDGDPDRFRGKGVLTAVKHVNQEIAQSLMGQDAADQRRLDERMIGLDGTPNKERLGANAILAASLASAKAAAQGLGVALYEHIGRLHSNPDPSRLPVPQMNILNGGAHADNSIDFQEFMVLPVGVVSFKEAVRCGAEIFHQLRENLIAEGLQTGVGDEGGFAPDFPSNEAGLQAVLSAVEQSGYVISSDVLLGLDLASSEFFEEGRYHLRSESKSYDSSEFVAIVSDLARRLPVISLEDPLAEDDWKGWIALTEELGASVQLTGDDLFVTNTAILKRGIEQRAANSILIKVNQIGTLSETLEAVALAQDNGFGVTVSHRSGETEDTTIADLAVGVGAGQIKTGSLCRAERTAKYNRLLRIEEQLGSKGSYAGRLAFPQL